MRRVFRPHTSTGCIVLIVTMLLFVIALPCGSTGVLAQAQAIAQAESQPAFEVISIRPTPPGPTLIDALRTYPGGRIVAKGATVEHLLTEAFGVQDFQIVGEPAWAKETRFDIQAKPSDAIAAKYQDVPSPKSPPSDEQRRMLQNLLIERFQMRTHSAHGTGLVFLLTKSGRPLRLQPPKDPNAFHWAGGLAGGLPGGDGISGINISMPELSARISDWLERPVEDHTGLSGTFDFVAKYGEEDAPSKDDITSSIFTSLKSIGLDLKKSTGSVNQLVIDHVAPPSEN
jgi:uncharacterized protein (TIGR03435 family)